MVEEEGGGVLGAIRGAVGCVGRLLRRLEDAGGAGAVGL